MTPLSPSDRAFAIDKAQLTMTSLASNIRAAEWLPYALPSGRSSRSGVFVCVGAGPSLSATGPELARLQREGALICTVNTALAAVNKYVVPDVVLAREVVDVSSHLRHPAGLRVLDISASPKVWDAAIAMGPTAFFCPYVEVACTLGVRPMFGGPAALTALVQLVQEWGAARIVLVGCDLALADDGKSYADGSAFSGQKAAVDPVSGVATNSGDGFDAKTSQHLAAGLRAYPRQESTIVIDRYGGGSIRTTPQWADQIPWLEEFARRHPDIECVDATGSGARKGGWIERPIGDVDGLGRDLVDSDEPICLASVPALERINPAKHAAAIAAIAAQCRTTLDVCANVVDPEGTIVAVPGYLEGADVVDLAAAGELVLNREKRGSVVDKIKGAYGSSLPNAAKAILTSLGENT
jgi:hypothetical protein